MNNYTRSKMVDVLKPSKQGVAGVRHYEVTEDECFMSNLRASLHGASFLHSRPGNICQLLVNGSLVMSDTDMEWRTNIGFMFRARGDILVGGLGLGFVLLAILNRDDVKSVTVVEKYQDVIDIVLPQIKHKKLTVVCADVFDYRKKLKGRKFDCIYFDIWPDFCRDNLAEMRRLEASYRGLLNPDGWIGSWGKKETKAFR